MYINNDFVLLNCPLCGGKADFVYLQRGSKFRSNVVLKNNKCTVKCLRCELELPRMYSEAEKAAKAWNKRAKPDNPPLNINDLTQMDGEPVWITWTDNRIKDQWWIVNSPRWIEMEFFDSYNNDDSGTIWIAYRNKQEEQK
ncbi:MAG TPA: Lar family restriction alleviation protein [Saprospiraceae bacterium]|nr:Lar family restriction alleviation protein [Saprospiraceae bacterium]